MEEEKQITEKDDNTIAYDTKKGLVIGTFETDDLMIDGIEDEEDGVIVNIRICHREDIFHGIRFLVRYLAVFERSVEVDFVYYDNDNLRIIITTPVVVLPKEVFLEKFDMGIDEKFETKDIGVQLISIGRMPISELNSRCEECGFDFKKARTRYVEIGNSNIERKFEETLEETPENEELELPYEPVFLSHTIVNTIEPHQIQ